jgi:trk system potassium uptake protein TrkH
MNRRAVLRVLGVIVLAVGLAMLPSVILSAVDGTTDLVPFLISSLLPVGIGVIMLRATRGHIDLRIRDGFAIVTFGWLAAALLGAMPYTLSGAVPSFADAFFESMSGFTTTGATIIADVESLPRATLLWRAMSQWIGGMGIVVLSVAVLPLLGIGGMQLFRAEVPGPSADRLSPRISSTAKILWGVYVGMTALEVLLLSLGGMGWLDAVCHTFSTVSTGGFSTRNASVGHFDSAFIDIVVTCFMFLAAANFSLHYWLLRGRWRQYVQNEEFRLYTAIAVLATLVIWGLVMSRTELSAAVGLRQAVFQTISILTSTGFGTADYLTWGPAAPLILYSLMFIGGCTGSTTGGMKMMRILILSKHSIRELQRQLHPQAILNVRMSGRFVPEDVILKMLGFFLFFMLVYITVAIIVTLLGVDPLTAMGASVATLSNIGPGLGEVGPASNYANLPSLAKVVLSVSMVLGRLELFTVLVVMTPMFWRRT